MYLDDEQGRWAIFKRRTRDADGLWEQLPPLAPQEGYTYSGPQAEDIGRSYGPGRYMIIAPEEKYGQRKVITIDIVEIVSYGAAPAPDPEVDEYLPTGPDPLLYAADDPRRISAEAEADRLVPGRSEE